MNARLQFGVLYRQFLFRLMDVELLSASAAGDASGLLGQLGALLISPSLIFALGAFTVGQAVRNQDPMAFPAASVELFLISTTMLVVGIFALLSWDSTFPDRRDVLVLAPLPVRGRTLFAAKVAASASALGLVVAAWNSFSATAWSLMLAPADSGTAGTLRYLAAVWVTVAAAGTFIYCLVLGIQGAAAQLPRRWYLRISPALQIASFVLFLAVFCFQPSPRPENQSTFQWLPAYWFLGCLQSLGGGGMRAVTVPFAWRAAVAPAVAILAAGSAFLLSYLRTIRKIVEEPDVTPGARGGIWLPPLGHSARTALAQFTIRTLARSRGQRTVLGFYLGGGLAIVAVYLEGVMEMTHFKWADILRLVGTPLMAASAVMLGAAWLGTRTVFAMPVDLRANWIFRLTPLPPAADSLAAARRALLTLAVLPILAASAVILFAFWPWRPAAEHLIVLALGGSILTDLSLRDFHKIPFACSYLPGKSKVHMVFWFGVIPAMMMLHKLAEFERDAMASALHYGIMIALLAAAAITARLNSTHAVAGPGAEIHFEEIPSDEPVRLNLNR